MILESETIDHVAVGITVATFVELLPPIAAALAIVWTLIRIYEWARYRFFNKKDSYVFTTPEDRVRGRKSL